MVWTSVETEPEQRWSSSTWPWSRHEYLFLLVRGGTRTPAQEAWREALPPHLSSPGSASSLPVAWVRGRRARLCSREPLLRGRLLVCNPIRKSPSLWHCCSSSYLLIRIGMWKAPQDIISSSTDNSGCLRPFWLKIDKKNIKDYFPILAQT